MGMSIHDGVGSKVSVFARKQMEKMGWQEGKGLGKNETGISKHIKAVKRDDSSGLGLESAQAAELSDNWWHDGFSKSLKAFSGSNGGKMSKRKKSIKKSRDSNDVADAAPTFDELFAATGGARLGMRARASQKGKFLRTEGAQEVDVLASELVHDADESVEPKVNRREMKTAGGVDSEDNIEESQDNDSVKITKKKKKRITDPADDSDLGALSIEVKKSKKNRAKDA